VSSVERFWTRRLRWRLLGAWRWPAFFAFTALDALILHLLPPLGAESDLEIPLALILASFGNLAILSGVDLLSRFWERRRAALGQDPGPPTTVLMDRLAGALLVAGALGVLAAGLANRPVIVSETEATEEAARTVRDWVLDRAPEEYRRNLETANTIRLAEGFFRICIADDTRRRPLCLFVDTNVEPTRIRRDPSTIPNAEYPGGRSR
jgi:hypothetical protein